jgi:hypothetical protein
MNAGERYRLCSGHLISVRGASRPGPVGRAPSLPGAIASPASRSRTLRRPRPAIRWGSRVERRVHGALSSVSVFRPEAGVRPISLTNVRPEGWAYYMFDADSCQLHPANRGEAPSEFATTVELSGHTAFVCEVSVENPQGHAVDFIVEIYSPVADVAVTKASITVAAGAHERWSVGLDAPAYGMHRVAFRTVMAANSPSNHQAFANWHAPHFRG